MKRHIMKRLMPLVLAALLGAGCSSEPETEVDPDVGSGAAARARAEVAAPRAAEAPPTAQVSAAEVAAAEAALRPFQQALMGTLTSALAEGPVVAVDACHVEAPQIPERASGPGIEVGRLSDRLRNPDNLTPDWAAPLWARMRATPADAAPQTVVLEDGRIGHIAPIRTAPMCLTCHGSELAPDVAAAIDARYPQDAARGYAAGDLRGAFWLTMPSS